MDIFGIGPLELIFIVIIVLLVLGPKEMVSALRTIGKLLRGIVTSDWWSSTKQTIQDVRKLPYDIMREAGMEDDLLALDEIRSATKTSTRPATPRKSTADEPANLSAWTNPPPPTTEESKLQEPETVSESENILPSILPPGMETEESAADPDNDPQADLPQTGQN